MSADQILPGTNLAEDPSPVWAAGTYAIGYESHVVDTHRVYRRALSTASTVRPDQDPAGWVDVRPTNRWAPFDEYTDTPAESSSDIVYVFSNIPAGPWSCVLEMAHISGGLTMPASSVWAGGNVPPFTTNKKHLVYFQRLQLGSATWLMSAIPNSAL